MEPVVSVNLNGNSYQLDQSAHDVLKAYLDRAEAALKDNPDKAEIMRELEQAIADKCAAYLSAHKSVVSAEEMKRALEEMGPVEGDAADAKTERPQSEAPTKKLYRIPEGAMVAGICTGVAAFLSVDVAVVRILMVIGAIITSGWLLLAYIVAMFIIPTAHTSAEWAAAHGAPFNAQEVIDEAKRHYSEFTQHGPPWTWRGGSRRAWKRAMRERARGWRDYWAYGPAPATPPSYAGRLFGGLFAIIFGFIRVLLAIIFLACLISLLTTGAIGYWHLPANIEMWQAVLLLIAVYALVSIPLRALRYASYGLTGWRSSYGYHGGEGFISLLALVLAGWFAYANIPEAHAWMDQVRDAGQRFIQDIRHE